MKRALLISILSSLALRVQPALPADSDQGKKLHDANCTQCHSTSVHAPGPQGQIARRAQQSGHLL
jgi:cytochrome c5